MNGWASTWNDILAGGNPRWKVTDENAHKAAFSHFQQYVKGEPANVSIFCPLAGDDPFVALLWSAGYTVTSIDLVPAAVEALKLQFGSKDEEWTKVEKDGTIVWKHSSGRANLMCGDALQSRPELVSTFDAVYDKDSFGALDKTMRKGFTSRIAEFTKTDAIIYLECKLRPNHDASKEVGPPFSLKEEDLMETENCYGKNFEYVAGLGTVYGSGMGGMQQTGHVMKRK
jgi:hypothetical protein